jgi:hypothetical protein
MKTTMYAHSSKESNYEKARELGLDGAATQNFRYALYEIEFEVDVNEETGDVTILKVIDGDNILIPQQK